MREKVNGIDIECLQGDITEQRDMTAVVNAANASLQPGGGVAGAIHRAAGPGLNDECRPLAPIEPGEAVVTGGHELPNAYVIHCLGPVYGVDRPSSELLASCYRNALVLADERGIESVAFPALSTGAFGYPMEAAARIALQTILDSLPELEDVQHIRLVLYDRQSREIHERVLKDLLANRANTGC